MPRLWVMVGLLTLAGFALPVEANPEQDHRDRSFYITKSRTTPTELEREIYLAVNHYRQSQRLSPLVWDQRISEQARLHSRDLAQQRIPFGHGGLRQRALALNRLIPSRRISENVACTFPGQNTANHIVQSWAASPRHQAALVDSMSLTGVGVVQGPSGAYCVTQIYIRPLH